MRTGRGHDYLTFFREWPEIWLFKPGLFHDTVKHTVRDVVLPDFLTPPFPVFMVACDMP
jgi:hypothetical protein